MIIQSEKLLKDTQAEYSKALEFLGLDDFELSNFEPSHVTVKNETTKVSMPDKIRKELEQFYEPYNQQLYNMLGWEDKDEGEETKS
eukprot:CAMPEP_0202457542 /NCGR_PEP_ID=MMETSP1360-20130828/14545_1 /ASSEMBLY_ACC=CAM_ASM_000848 /TAXON_ID=515479 /ORGANISM="Licmophora paradoxa, Strain CCMP2313" /LENGTH=85 /DNA_ID=CAMNT_0049077671 /DNA_START=18 /DNA_END=275 /DNA_ORIENTATION=+